MVKINRVVYGFWHNKSAKGRVGYIGKDKFWPKRANLLGRKNRKEFPKLYQALNKYPLSVWRVDVLASNFCSDKALRISEINWIKKI